MNTTLTQLKSDQDQITEEALDHHLTPPPIQPPPPSDTAALWEAVTRLDYMVVNNTVKVRHPNPNRVRTMIWSHVEDLLTH